MAYFELTGSGSPQTGVCQIDLSQPLLIEAEEGGFSIFDKAIFALFNMNHFPSSLNVSDKSATIYIAKEHQAPEKFNEIKDFFTKLTALVQTHHLALAKIEEARLPTILNDISRGIFHGVLIDGIIEAHQTKEIVETKQKLLAQFTQALCSAAENGINFVVVKTIPGLLYVRQELLNNGIYVEIINENMGIISRIVT